MKQLGKHFNNFQRTGLVDDQTSCDIPTQSSNTVTIKSKSIQHVKETIAVHKPKQRPLGLKTEVKNT